MTGSRGPLSKPQLRAVNEADCARDLALKRGHSSDRVRLDPPEWLSASAKREFRRVTADLHSRWPGILTPLDVPSIALMCETYAIAQAAAKAMRGKGNEPQVVDYDESRGRPRKPLAWTIFRDAATTYGAFAREFGLTLASRVRLGLDTMSDSDDEDDLDRLLRTP